MTFRFQCPNGHTLKAEPSMAGMKMRCPKCQSAVKVPLSTESVEAQAARPSSAKSTLAVPKKRPGAPPPAPAKESNGASRGTEIRRKKPPPLPQKSAPADDRWRNEPTETPPKQTPPPRPEPAVAPAAKEKEPTPPPRPSVPTRPAQQAVTEAPRSTVEAPPIEAPPLAPELEAVEKPKRKGYVPDGERRQTVYWLGFALLVVAVIGFLPAREFYAIGSAPAWAVVLWFITALQIAYIVYMVSIPDWSTTWVAMLGFAAVAAMYGFVLAMAIWTAGSDVLPLGLEPFRLYVTRWAGGMLLLSFLASFTAGRISHTWHKRYRYV